MQIKKRTESMSRCGSYRYCRNFAYLEEKNKDYGCTEKVVEEAISEVCELGYEC